MSEGHPWMLRTDVPILPPHLRFNTVPRNLRWRLPEGWAYCGPAFVAALKSDTRHLILSWNLWPEEVQDVMGGMVVVSAVAATLAPETCFPWPGFWVAPSSADRLRPRVPRLLRLPRGGSAPSHHGAVQTGRAVGLASGRSKGVVVALASGPYPTLRMGRVHSLSNGVIE